MASEHFIQASEVTAEKTVQTRDVSWLCLYDMYPKFHIPNLYRIGSTETHGELDYCFTYRTENVGEFYLLHLFITNHREGPFSVVVNISNEVHCEKETNVAVMKKIPIQFNIKGIPKLSHNYLNTYSFTELDVECLKEKNIFIAFSFPREYNDVYTNEKSLDTLHLLNNIRLQHDYLALLFDPIDSDLVVEASNGTKFLVHKHILMTNSDVFKQMFTSNELQKENNCNAPNENKYFKFASIYNYYKFGHKKCYFKIGHVFKNDNNMCPERQVQMPGYNFGENRDYYKFEGVKTNVLRCMVEFAYTGMVQYIDNVNFVKVLYLAHKYELEELSELAQYILSVKINKDNAINILTAAHECKVDDLKLKTLKFISTNRDALKSVRFKNFNNIELLTDISKFMVL